MEILSPDRTYTFDVVFPIIERLIIEIYRKNCADEPRDYHVSSQEILRAFKRDPEGSVVKSEAWKRYEQIKLDLPKHLRAYKNAAELAQNMIAMFNKEFTQAIRSENTMTAPEHFERVGEESTYRYRPRNWQQLRQEKQKEYELAEDIPHTKNITSTPTMPPIRADVVEESLGTSLPSEAQIASSPVAIDIDEPKENVRSRVATYRILRDTRIAREVKMQHNYCCQICEQTIMLKDGSFYAEAHHIRPLGTPHNGPDISANILCVCPTHHVLLDYGVIHLSMDTIHHTHHHRIEQEFINYHNIFVCVEPE